MKNVAFIGIGSNMGDRYRFLQRAVEMIEGHELIKVEETSSIYETDPVGYTEQAPFLNMVIRVKTELGAYALLDALNEIEQNLGRKREIKWGPRTLDLDILLYNRESINSEKLTVPHPRMLERAFVMVPLLEIESAPLPGRLGGISISDKEGVRIWKQKNGEGAFALFES